jgi:hypothetical protein
VVHSKDYIKYKYFSIKRNVHLGGLSIKEGFSLAYSTIHLSNRKLYSMAVRGIKDKKSLMSPEDFVMLLDRCLSEQTSILKACFATSINYRSVFEADKFAVALKRMGVVDNIELALQREGVNPNTLTRVTLYAPWYWADVVSSAISHEKKKISNIFTRLVRVFEEDVSIEDYEKALQRSLTTRAMERHQ